VENQILQEDLKEAQGKINSKDLVIRELKDSKENQNQTNIIALKTKISSLETEVSKLRQSEIKAHMAQNEAEEKVTKLNQEI
jgi:outer membrane murein-binding lipoprotein Lpp